MLEIYDIATGNPLVSCSLKILNQGYDNTDIWIHSIWCWNRLIWNYRYPLIMHLNSFANKYKQNYCMTALLIGIMMKTVVLTRMIMAAMIWTLLFIITITRQNKEKRNKQSREWQESVSWTVFIGHAHDDSPNISRGDRRSAHGNRRIFVFYIHAWHHCSNMTASTHSFIQMG